MLVQNSDSVVVQGNTVVVGSSGNGIGIIYQPREDNGTAAIAQNNTLVDNTLVFLAANHTAHGFVGGVSNCQAGTGGPPGAAGNAGDPRLRCFADRLWGNTTFDRNAYFFQGAAPSSQLRFRWRPPQNASGSPYLAFAGWQSAGNDLHGAIAAVRSGVVPAACYAATPAPHMHPGHPADR